MVGALFKFNVGDGFVGAIHESPLRGARKYAQCHDKGLASQRARTIQFRNLIWSPTPTNNVETKKIIIGTQLSFGFSISCLHLLFFQMGHK
jgi:hypothetical protein